VLNLHFGTSPLDSFLADLEKTIRKESGIAKIDAMKLFPCLRISLPWFSVKGLNVGDGVYVFALAHLAASDERVVRFVFLYSSSFCRLATFAETGIGCPHRVQSTPR
jgi:hypothetical protein